MKDLHPQPLFLTLLGPYALTTEQQQFTIRGDKTRALLAYLAVESGHEQRRDRLMALFWPEVATDQAQANLRQTVHRLRRTLPKAKSRFSDEGGELIISTRTTVAVDPHADLTVDVNVFRRLLAEVREHRHPTLSRCQACRRRLESAVDLYQDEFLSDLYLADSNGFEDWAAGLRAVLQQEVLDALGKLADLYMTRGNFSRAEPLSRRQIAIDPLRESAYRQLMTLLARSGRKAEALAVYEACRKQLAEELGVDPSAATRALHEDILTGELEDISSAADQDTFELREEIARGAFGVIYRAYQPSVGRDVAIKVIPPEVVDSPDFARRLESEARIVARLEHPHIVPLHAYWRDQNGAHLVMRLLPGGSLKEMLDRGPVDHVFILRILSQITDALDAVHEHGVVHRDLKPANILLDEHQNAYLTDFGIAKELAQDRGNTAGDELLGSPAYIAPEQIRNEPVTPRADIYSLGIILYEMLAGELPFGNMNLPAVLQAQLSDPLPRLSGRVPNIPQAVDQVLARATSKRPEDRYPDVLSFAADVKQALAGEYVPVVRAAARLVAGEPPGLADAPTKRPFFVGREGQLAALHRHLAKAAQNHGQVVCVAGGAGRGKSALLAEFAHQAMNADPQLIVAMGSCHAYSTVSAPYLPFREILSVLTADVEARLRAGVVSPDHARRLWTALPASVRVLVEQGPDLIGSLLPAGSLMARARSAAAVDAPWIADLQALAARRDDGEDGEPDPNRLFGQVTAVLHALSEDAPLLLILDDLQWIDSASVALLFHLSRQLSGRRLMLACAYRADEVSSGRDGRRHPLEKVLAEIKRDYGSVWLDLAEL